jgi:restriction system protein
VLYDRSVAELMKEAAIELPEECSSGQVISWFGQKYPKVSAGTVRAHIIGLTANHPSRHHYPSLARRRPLYVQVGRGQLARYQSASEGVENVDEAVQSVEVSMVSVSEIETESAELASMEFALEAYLEEFIVTNWELIDWGRRLAIWSGPGGQTGHQLSTPVGRLDFLATDLDTDALVAIELKRGKTSDQVVGQVARYMGWLREKLAAPGQLVEGVIVAGETDAKLYYAATAVQGLSVKVYEVSFNLEPAPLPE